jgi:hypothetical protein
MYRDHLAAKVAPTMFDENSFSFFCRRHVTWQYVKWVSEWANGADDLQKLIFCKNLLLVKG